MKQSANNKEELLVIKIGGNVIDNEQNLNDFLRDFSHLPQKKILVHGGGKIATAIGERMNIISQYVDGRRITDCETIDLVTMVYGGLINKKIIALLQSINCNAIGITGADANCVPAIKRPVKEIDYGWVGDIDEKKINVNTWSTFLNNGMIPVMAPLTHDEKGQMLNTNADTIAASIAIALSDLYNTKLVMCFEKNGVLENVDNENSVITKINAEIFNDLNNRKLIHSGILPKINNAMNAIKKGVDSVVIGNSAQLTDLIAGRSGTKFLADD
ncbi:MAG: acetylglutamate kinase [Ginsengibacter sp.]